MIGLIVVLLTFLGGFGQYGFSTVEVGVILRNWCGITRAKFFRITPGE